MQKLRIIDAVTTTRSRGKQKHQVRASTQMKRQLIIVNQINSFRAPDALGCIWIA